jgi:peptidoglycan/xylan/chitin deacetylase (PgdA/CDA1 family)
LKKSYSIITLLLCFIGLQSIAAKPLNLGEFKNMWSGQYVPTLYNNVVNHYQLKVKDTSSPAYIQKIFTDTVSLKKKFIRVRLKVNDLKSLQGIELRFTSSEEGYDNFYAISIPTFTDHDFNNIQSDSWMDYTFTLGEAVIHGKPNIDAIKRIGFYVAGQNLNVSFKSISIEDALVPAIVSFTFDDGYKDQRLAADIMAKYLIPGTAYIMPDQIGNNEYLTVEDLKVMKNDYLWGLSSHHIDPILKFTIDELDTVITNIFDFIYKNGGNEEARHFAYPLGKQNRKLTLPLIRKRFLSARLAGGGAETLPPSDWHMLRTFNVMPSTTPEIIMKRIKLAQENNEWLILMFHRFTNDKNPTDPLVYNLDEFEKLCKMIFDDYITVLPVHQVYEAFN